MIPLKLTLEGLYSYQKRQEIDFTKLTQSHIFGIFGSVGSGKSTILEAITFAIYGKTERLNLSGDKRNYNMMNLKSDILFIEFVFKIIDDEYKIIVKSRRNSKKFEDVKSHERSAYIKNNNDWLPVELIEISNKIGLSYENFKRTIIIPQGKFQEFLQLGNKDRNVMMKELFNLEKYDLFYKVTALEGKNNKCIQNIEGQLQQLGEIKPEQLDELKTSLLSLKEISIILSKSLIEKQEEELALKNLKILIDKIRNFKNKFSLLNQQKGKYKKIEEQIKKYEYCLINFKHLFDTFNNIKGKIKTLKSDIKNDEYLFDKYKKEISSLEKDFLEVKSIYDKKDEIKKGIEELIKIKDVILLRDKNSKLIDRINEGNKCIENTDKSISDLIITKENIEKGIKDNKEKLPDILILSEARQWHFENKTLEENKNNLSKEISDLENDISELNKKLDIEFKNNYFNDISKTLELEKIINCLKEKISDFKNNIKPIEEKIEHLKVQQKLQDYASELKEGKACPLCGSLTHPLIMSSEKLTEALEENNDNKNKIEVEISSIENSLVNIRNIETKSEIKKLQKDKLTLKLKETIKEIENHQNKINKSDYSDKKILDDDFKLEKNLQKEIKNLEKNLEAKNSELKIKSENLENYKAGLEKIKNQKIESETRIETYLSQLELLNFDDFKSESDYKLKEKIESETKKYDEINGKYNLLNNQITAKQKLKDELSGKISANNKSLENEVEQENIIKKDIENAIEKSVFNNTDEIKNILELEIDIENEKNKVNDFKQGLNTLEKTIKDLEIEIGEKKYNADAHALILQNIKKLKEDIQNKNQEIGKTENNIKNLKENLQKQKDLQEKLDKLKLRAADIKTMKSLFKGSGFVNYVSSVHLRNICNAANDRFKKITRQKLSLEMTDDNNFQVRDFLNGGNIRNIKTLSGGQTFQASLSLALALSDSIQKHSNSTQNFFFLDEGFGSLDKEALRIVFQTLKSLRKENRVIGLISHVEEMQQEIDVYVKVKNTAEEGSILEFSWN